MLPSRHRTFATRTHNPNPFNPRTTITYDLPRACSFNLRIYDMRGRMVRSLVEDYVTSPQRGKATWDGTDELGRRVAGGVYFNRLEADGLVDTKRMVLVK